MAFKLGTKENKRMTEVKVQVTNLVKNFGTNQVLKDINVTVQANEVVVIIGPCLLYTSPSPRD